MRIHCSGYGELTYGYVHEVVIACGAEVIARHTRSWEKEDYIYDPLHYLALIEQKTNALDQAAPLADWELSEAFLILRRLMEARMGKKGKREFVQVLRLLETFRITDVEAGIQSALERGTIGFDAVKHLVLCRIERRPPRLDMTVYPYLPKARVAVTSARDYMALLSGGGSCLAVGFITASALVHELLEAQDEKRLLRLQKQLNKYGLLIIDELG